MCNVCNNNNDIYGSVLINICGISAILPREDDETALAMINSKISHAGDLFTAKCNNPIMELQRYPNGLGIAERYGGNPFDIEYMYNNTIHAYYWMQKQDEVHARGRELVNVLKTNGIQFNDQMIFTIIMDQMDLEEKYRRMGIPITFADAVNMEKQKPVQPQSQFNIPEFWGTNQRHHRADKIYNAQRRNEARFNQQLQQEEMIKQYQQQFTQNNGLGINNIGIGNYVPIGNEVDNMKVTSSFAYFDDKERCKQEDLKKNIDFSLDKIVTNDNNPNMELNFNNTSTQNNSVNDMDIETYHPNINKGNPMTTQQYQNPMVRQVYNPYQYPQMQPNVYPYNQAYPLPYYPGRVYFPEGLTSVIPPEKERDNMWKNLEREYLNNMQTEPDDEEETIDVGAMMNAFNQYQANKLSQTPQSTTNAFERLSQRRFDEGYVARNILINNSKSEEQMSSMMNINPANAREIVRANPQLSHMLDMEMAKKEAEQAELAEQNGLNQTTIKDGTLDLGYVPPHVLQAETYTPGVLAQWLQMRNNSAARPQMIQNATNIVTTSVPPPIMYPYQNRFMNNAMLNSPYSYMYDDMRDNSWMQPTKEELEEEERQRELAKLVLTEEEWMNNPTEYICTIIEENGSTKYYGGEKAIQSMKVKAAFQDYKEAAVKKWAEDKRLKVYNLANEIRRYNSQLADDLTYTYHLNPSYFQIFHDKCVKELMNYRNNDKLALAKSTVIQAGPDTHVLPPKPMTMEQLNEISEEISQDPNRKQEVNAIKRGSSVMDIIYKIQLFKNIQVVTPETEPWYNDMLSKSMSPIQWDSKNQYIIWKKLKSGERKRFNSDIEYDEWFDKWWFGEENIVPKTEKQKREEYVLKRTKMRNDRFNWIVSLQPTKEQMEKLWTDTFNQLVYNTYKGKIPENMSMWEFFNGEYGLGYIHNCLLIERGKKQVNDFASKLNPELTEKLMFQKYMEMNPFSNRAQFDSIRNSPDYINRRQKFVDSIFQKTDMGVLA